MPLDFFDLSLLGKSFCALSGLTGLEFSLYDEEGAEVIVPARRDKVLNALLSGKHGSEMYRHFINANMSLTRSRRAPLLAKGPSLQYHAFIPFAHRNRVFTAVVEAFYCSPEDFRKFIVAHASNLGIPEASADEWMSRIVVIPLRVFENKIPDIRSLLEQFLAASRVKGEYERRLEDLSMLSLKVSNLFFLHQDLEHLHDGIVREAASLMNAERCSLMTPSAEENVLSVTASQGMEYLHVREARVRPGERIAGRVFQEGMPILIDRWDTLRKYAPSPQPSYKTMSSVSIPLRVADEVLGVLNLSDKRSRTPFTEQDLTLLAPFALQTSILLKLASCYSMSEQMKELSVTDQLTGLFNRRYFDLRLGEEYQRAKRSGQGFSLALIDIDDFKLFNDTEGHLAGDHVLREISSIMTKTIRTNDILVRFGGEEFAIIMPQTGKHEAFTVAERAIGTIKGMIPPTWKKYPKGRITASAGISAYPDCGEPMENVIREADKALYSGKVRGKDRVVVWNDETKGFSGFPRAQDMRRPWFFDAGRNNLREGGGDTA